MANIIKKFSNQKSVTIIMAWACLTGLIILMLPLSLSNYAGITLLSKQASPYMWVIVLISGSFLLTQLVILFFDILTVKIESRHKLQSRVHMIKCLDFEEKAVLREFVIQKKNVLALPLTEPAVTNLLSAGVLEPAFETQEIKGRTRLIKLSIAIEAREKLTHRVLGLPIGQLTDDQAKILKSARPGYARSNYIALRD